MIVESKTPKVWMDEVMGLNINGRNKSMNKKESSLKVGDVRTVCFGYYLKSSFLMTSILKARSRMDSNVDGQPINRIT